MNIIDLNFQTKTFREQWSIYISLYWSRIYSYFNKSNFVGQNIIFPKESILLWGYIPYKIYKVSSFYNNNRIEVVNEDLHVYYYLRKINHTNLKFFAFVNVMGVKDLVQTSMDEDHVFLKNLYDSKIGIHSIFDHEYKDHCWDVLLKEFIE
jgi:hypothetical protein